MKVLVTGHLGYIGTVMVPELIERGHDVVGLDSDLFRECSFDDTSIVRVPELIKDVRDVSISDMRGFDAVIHLANLSNDPLGNLNPNLTYEINHLGSVQLASFARKAGVERFLFSSSCSLYGAAGLDAVTESAEFNPVTPYGKAKVLAERDIALLASDEFSPIFLRNATAYGVSPRFRFDLVVNNLTAWALATGKIMIKSDGSPWRPLVHIRDITSAFIAALEAPKATIHNEAFNVGSTGENYQIRDIARIVGETVPNCEVAFAEGASPDKRSYQVSFDKIESTLPGFSPEWTARRGVEEVYEALRDRSISVDEFEGPRYRRIKSIQNLLAEGKITSELRRTDIVEAEL
ncbi:MAG: SDR family oxidoreductase [Rhodothermales bacterium]|nr:SDR family oxidoreductase [Rhodothermales bacterium]